MRLRFFKQTIIVLFFIQSFFSFHLFTDMTYNSGKENQEKYREIEFKNIDGDPVLQSNAFPRYGLYSCNWDGSNFTRIFGSDTVFIIDGRISPDEKRIVFRSYRDADKDGIINEYQFNDTEICTMDINGNNFQWITNDSYMDALPNWSPDGNKILWTTSRFSDSDLDIAVMCRNGTYAKRLTSSTYHESDPCWVNDKVVYTRNYSIWMMYDNGSNQKELTLPPKRGEDHPVWTMWKYGDYDPALSPDETMISFERLQNDTYEEFDLFVANISDIWDVTGEKDLSKNNWSDGIPEFSPDGSKIVFWTSGIPPSDPGYPDNVGEMFLINTTGEDRYHIDVDFNPPHPVLDVIFMKENPDFFPSATWDIDGKPDIVFGGEFHGEWIPPLLLEAPEDMEFPEGSTEHILWNVTDTNGDNYTIEVNGAHHLTDDWDNNPIVLDLSSFTWGQYEINITIFDDIAYSITDIVNVNITYVAPVDDDDDDDDDDSSNDSGVNAAIIGYNIYFLIGMVPIIIVLIYVKRDKIRRDKRK